MLPVKDVYDGYNIRFEKPWKEILYSVGSFHFQFC